MTQDEPIEFPVTKQDIREGRPGDPFRCAISRAARRAFNIPDWIPVATNVSIVYPCVDDNDIMVKSYRQYMLDDDTYAWRIAFDTNKAAAQPFTARVVRTLW